MHLVPSFFQSLNGFIDVPVVIRGFFFPLGDCDIFIETFNGTKLCQRSKGNMAGMYFSTDGVESLRLFSRSCHCLYIFRPGFNLLELYRWQRNETTTAITAVTTAVLLGYKSKRYKAQT